MNELRMPSDLLGGSVKLANGREIPMVGLGTSAIKVR